MKIKNNLAKLLIGTILIGSTIGCSSLNYTSIKNPLDRREAEITSSILRKEEKEFIKIEKEFYGAINSGNTNTKEFYSLQTKYHSMKAQREKYEKILNSNTKK